MSFVCEYCKKSFVKETSIEIHMCEPKRRRMQKDESGVRLGFQAYIKFYETMQGSAKNKTYDDFCESSYYKAFVKFGRYCVNTHVINPPQFMNWLLKNSKKIDRWCSDQIYTEYLAQHLLVEAVDDALKRAVEHSIRWEETTGHPAKDMLRYGNANALCYDITAGRISPWVIYNSQSGIEFLGNLSTEQVAIVWPYINSDAWHKKFSNYPADQEFVKDILTQAGW
jgi:hypothetical protein